MNDVVAMTDKPTAPQQEMRECKDCHVEKTLAAFYKYKSKKGALRYRTRCKLCTVKLYRQYRRVRKSERRSPVDLEQIAKTYPCRHVTFYFEDTKSDSVMRCKKCGRRWARVDKVDDMLVISPYPTNYGFGTETALRTRRTRRDYLKLDHKKIRQP